MKKIEEEVDLLEMFDKSQFSKSEQSLYPLSTVIKDEISKHVNNVKRILKDDKDAQDYMLKQLLSAYKNSNIEHEMNKWVYNNYNKPIFHNDYKNYCDLLHTVPDICLLMEGWHPLIKNELKHSFLLGFNSTEEHRLATKLAIAHEFIIVSDIPASEIKALGEVYEDMI